MGRNRGRDRPGTPQGGRADRLAKRVHALEVEVAAARDIAVGISLGQSLMGLRGSPPPLGEFARGLYARGR